MSTRTGSMLCPVDQASLVMSERQGIEIDYCPTCRGVWLDRGELDKIIERAAPAAPAPGQAAPPQQGFAPQPPQQGYPPQTGHWQPQVNPGRNSDDYHHGYGHGYPQKRRKSFLAELFD